MRSSAGAHVEHEHGLVKPQLVDVLAVELLVDLAPAGLIIAGNRIGLAHETDVADVESGQIVLYDIADALQVVGRIGVGDREDKLVHLVGLARQRIVDVISEELLIYLTEDLVDLCQRRVEACGLHVRVLEHEPHPLQRLTLARRAPVLEIGIVVDVRQIIISHHHLEARQEGSDIGFLEARCGRQTHGEMFVGSCFLAIAHEL